MNTTSPHRESSASWWLALFGAVASIIFLANPTFGGLIPLEIPDAFPIIGNLDETIVSGILFACLARLGINVLPGMHRSRDTVIDHAPRETSGP